MSRYRVGCAGMFVLGMDYGMDDEDEAIVACEAGPAGCEVYDTVTGQWIGPACPEDIAEARQRLAARAALDGQQPSRCCRYEGSDGPCRRTSGP